MSNENSKNVNADNGSEVTKELVEIAELLDVARQQNEDGDVATYKTQARARKLLATVLTIDRPTTKYVFGNLTLFDALRVADQAAPPAMVRDALFVLRQALADAKGMSVDQILNSVGGSS